jgi:hypothetical protein
LNTKSFTGALFALSLLSLLSLPAGAASGPLADAHEYVDQHTQAPIDILAGFKLGDQLAALPGTEAALWRVRVLSRALRGVDADSRTKAPIAAWLEKHQDEVVFSEPSGGWYLVQAKVWELHDRSKDSPFAEEIAWEASNTLLGGECEGYLPCYTQADLEGMGRYLELYPRGKWKDQALESLYWMLDILSAEEFPLDANDKAIAKEILGRWDKVLAAVPGAEQYRQGLVKIAKEYKLP